MKNITKLFGFLFPKPVEQLETNEGSVVGKDRIKNEPTIGHMGLAPLRKAAYRENPDAYDIFYLNLSGTCIDVPKDIWDSVNIGDRVRVTRSSVRVGNSLIAHLEELNTVKYKVDFLG